MCVIHLFEYGCEHEERQYSFCPNRRSGFLGWLRPCLKTSLPRAFIDADCDECAFAVPIVAPPIHLSPLDEAVRDDSALSNVLLNDNFLRRRATQQYNTHITSSPSSRLTLAFCNEYVTHQAVLQSFGGSDYDEYIYNVDSHMTAKEELCLAFTTETTQPTLWKSHPRPASRRPSLTTFQSSSLRRPALFLSRPTQVTEFLPGLRLWESAQIRQEDDTLPASFCTPTDHVIHPHLERLTAELVPVTINMNDGIDNDVPRHVTCPAFSQTLLVPDSSSESVLGSIERVQIPHGPFFPLVSSEDFGVESVDNLLPNWNPLADKYRTIALPSPALGNLALPLHIELPQLGSSDRNSDTNNQLLHQQSQELASLAGHLGHYYFAPSLVRQPLIPITDNFAKGKQIRERLLAEEAEQRSEVQSSIPTLPFWNNPNGLSALSPEAEPYIADLVGWLTLPDRSTAQDILAFVMKHPSILQVFLSGRVELRSASLMDDNVMSTKMSASLFSANLSLSSRWKLLDWLPVFLAWQSYGDNESGESLSAEQNVEEDSEDVVERKGKDRSQIRLEKDEEDDGFPWY